GAGAGEPSPPPCAAPPAAPPGPTSATATWASGWPCSRRPGEEPSSERSAAPRPLGRAVRTQKQAGPRDTRPVGPPRVASPPHSAPPRLRSFLAGAPRLAGRGGGGGRAGRPALVPPPPPPPPPHP